MYEERIICGRTHVPTFSKGLNRGHTMAVEVRDGFSKAPHLRRPIPLAKTNFGRHSKCYLMNIIMA